MAPTTAAPPPVPAHGGAQFLRAAALIIAVIMIAAALFHPAFRHPEGHLGVRFCLMLALAASVALAGIAAGSRWARAALWLALATSGQAIALQIVHAGMMIGHQHYQPVAQLFSSSRYLPELAFIALQGVIVALAVRGRVSRWLAQLTLSFGTRRLVIAAAVVALTSTALSRSITAYLGELGLATLIQAINLTTILLAIAALPEDALAVLRRQFDRILSGSDDRRRDLFPLLPALWVLFAGAVLAWFVYQNHPHVPDEVVYLYPARYLARGMVSLPLPPVPAAFELDLMTYQATRWFSPVPVGWPAVLAIGAFFGAPWLVNPVLNAINVILAYLLLRALFDRRTARLGTLLLCVSPWFVFMGMNFMTHTFTLTCALAAAVLVARLRRGDSPLWAIPGGIAIGAAGLIRPLEGLTIAVLLGFWALGPWRWSGRTILQTLILALAAMATGALTLPYNAHLAGDPFTFPLMAYTDSVYGVGTNALGFGANRGLGWPGLDPFPGHGLVDVLVNANLNISSVNTELLGWSTGSLLLVTLLLLSRRLTRQDVWLLIVIGAILGVHSLYWFSGGPDFGARYWYLILFPCIGLSARALQVLGELLAERSTPERRASRGGMASAHTRVTAFAFACALIALISFFPWRATDKYFHYRNMRPDVRRLAKQHEFGRSLVLVRGRRHPDYASAAIYNPLDLEADAPVYIWDRDAAITREALIVYSDRDVWILDGPTRTGAGFRVVAGPIPARALLNNATTP